MSASAVAQIAQAMDAQTTAFRADVLAGLAQAQKTLPSRWLYDDAGSDLFEKITSLQEYYPTRTETAILTGQAESLANFCGPEAVIVEYGAGAIIKAGILISALQQPRLYVPVDIAGEFLAKSSALLRTRFDTLEILPVAADFTRSFSLPEEVPGAFQRVGVFLGSTIGNLDQEQAVTFLAMVRRHTEGGESGHAARALIGIDLVKSTDVLIPAYDDASGVTAAFNLNLLARINRELDGTFNLSTFRHEARWNGEEPAIEMHLVSGLNQSVAVDDVVFEFAKGETIHTESSRKYTLERFAALASRAGWRVADSWTDRDRQFAVVGLVD
ncbi:MAG: L-histidine N(alpha)-methyltransferase, partial [Hyphomicrobiaceae bacterium]